MPEVLALNSSKLVQQEFDQINRYFEVVTEFMGLKFACYVVDFHCENESASIRCEHM